METLTISPNIDWINGCLTKTDHNEQLFYDTLQDCVLYQLVTQPTRIRPGTDPHILDLIVTNEEAMVQDITYTAGLGSSDHTCTCIQFHLNCTATRTERNTTGYNYGNANFNQLRDILQEVDWDNKLKELNSSKTWEIISELINKAIDTCIPKFNQPPKKRHKYLNRRALKLRYEI